MPELGICYCFALPAEASGEEERIASRLLDLSRLPPGAAGMAMLVSRLPRMPRQVYIFPGSVRGVAEAVERLVREYGGRVCDPPKADEVVFLVGSPAVWRRLPP